MNSFTILSILVKLFLMSGVIFTLLGSVLLSVSGMIRSAVFNALLSVCCVICCIACSTLRFVSTFVSCLRLTYVFTVALIAIALLLLFAFAILLVFLPIFGTFFFKMCETMSFGVSIRASTLGVYRRIAFVHNTPTFSLHFGMKSLVLRLGQTYQVFESIVFPIAVDVMDVASFRFRTVSLFPHVHVFENFTSVDVDVFVPCRFMHDCFLLEI